MKAKLFPVFIFLALLFILPAQIQAQRSGDQRVDQYFEDDKSFVQRLWYGGNFNLGFSGANGFNIFNAGLAPMVGYKIIEPVSIGPRVSVDYTYVKGFDGSGNPQTVQPISFSVGAFARYKFLPSIFAHVEYEIENNRGPGLIQQCFGCPIYIATDNNGPIIVQEIRDNFYLGAGYTSSTGKGLGFEMLALYNVTEGSNPTSINLPFTFRFGLTYNY